MSTEKLNQDKHDIETSDDLSLPLDSKITNSQHKWYEQLLSSLGDHIVEYLILYVLPAILVFLAFVFITLGMIWLALPLVMIIIYLATPVIVKLFK